ncbi:helix-turn-helix domain-containing protein [Rhizobium sp. 768_B6_N1_8]|uniref:helix-turn-helix domain-containing protein n=1 Tax=unclassified Rhizobium TaxID=2613769 RepID=UPI003F25FF94
MALFRDLVGTTPQAYLTGWRLTLARRKLAKGGKVKSAARQVGFGSAAAFSAHSFANSGTGHQSGHRRD